MCQIFHRKRKIVTVAGSYHRPARLTYKPYFFDQQIIFFSYNKSANDNFNHGLSAARETRQSIPQPNQPQRELCLNSISKQRNRGAIQKRRQHEWHWHIL